MKLIVNAVPNESGDKMILNLFAKMPDVPEDKVRAVAEALAETLKVDLRGVELENCERDDVGDAAILQAEWYEADDHVAPAIVTVFNLAAVHAAIVKVLRASKRWQRIKPLGKKKATWQLNRIPLGVKGKAGEQ